MTVQIRRLDQSDMTWLSRLHAPLIENDEVTLRKCLRISAISWMGLVDEKIGCIWGLVPPSLMSDQAYIWLFTSKIAEEHQFLLVRYSQLMIEDMLKEFPTIVGHCRVDTPRSIRWLRWLGAKFGEPKGKGIPFVIRKKP